MLPFDQIEENAEEIGDRHAACCTRLLHCVVLPSLLTAAYAILVTLFDHDNGVAGSLFVFMAIAVFVPCLIVSTDVLMTSVVTGRRISATLRTYYGPAVFDARDVYEYEYSPISTAAPATTPIEYSIV